MDEDDRTLLEWAAMPETPFKLEMAEPRYRTPVGVAVTPEDAERYGSMKVVCADGSVWHWLVETFMDTEGWHEFPPIPGTRRAAELEDKDGS